MDRKNLDEFEEDDEKVFILRNLVEVRIPKEDYESLSEEYSKEKIISYSRKKKILNRVTRRKLVFITSESNIPLIGHSAFGIIDRGTNLLQVRTLTGCNLNCIFCSVDEGKSSTTRKTDYIVDPDYMAREIRRISKIKGEGIEIHLDGQGEPSLYPYLKEFLEKIEKIEGVKKITMQSNGLPLDADMISDLEEYLTRINLSINSLDEEKAIKLHGMKNYSPEKVVKIAERIVDSKIDLLIAPVWVPGYNDEEIPQIIEFALSIGAGNECPPLGVQKYEPYRYGRKIEENMNFEDFYGRLREHEDEYGVKLVLEPHDFGIEKRERIHNPFQKGERAQGNVVADGRLFNEKLVVSRDRSVAYVGEADVGETVEFEVVRAKDGIIVGVEI